MLLGFEAPLAQLDYPPLILDSFAGGGGASTGIEMALGRSPDIAINHNPAALALHAANHPETLHLSENVYKVDPLDHVAGKHIGLGWFSPDCKHFSKAKGGKPVERNIRDLAWIIPGWVERIQESGGSIDVIILENVEEFRDWGPLLDTERGLMPDPEARGQTFQKWCKALRRLGGKIEWRELRACDFGAPTEGVVRIAVAVAQDYMCEPFMLAKTGLSVMEHQRLTIERYDALVTELDRLFDCRCPFPVMPVLQGYAPVGYVRHLEMYGERLKPGMWVGVGSVCKRNGDPARIVEVLTAIKAIRPDLNLHGFGIKLTALGHPGVRELLFSADSMAWSDAARKQGRNANCWTEAARYRDAVGQAIALPPSPWQMPLFLVDRGLP